MRALVLDAKNRVLLLRYPTDDDPGVWITPGGAVEDRETAETALRRELREELHVAPELGPWIWTRRHIWSWNRAVYETTERIALVPVDVGQVRPDPSDSLFYGGVRHGFEWRWWTLDELQTTSDEVAPRRLPSLLADLLRNGAPPAPIDAGV